MDCNNVGELKLSIECGYHALTAHMNMTPQYFIFKSNASHVSPIAVKWYEKNMGIDSTSDDLSATKQNYLYQLIQWLSHKTRNNTNISFQNIKSCINNIWKDTSSNIALGSFVELTNGSEIDMACRIGAVGHKEQKKQFDFEWKLLQYLNTKFKYLVSDIVLTLISCYKILEKQK